MDHAYIKEHSIVERYEMRQLSSAESALFEDHFVDCPECQGHLQTAQDFRKALQAANSKGRLSMESKPAAGTFMWRPAFLVAASCAALLILSTVFQTQQTRHLNRELSRATDEVGAWHRQYEAQRQANAELQEKLPQPGQPPQGLPVVASVFALNMTRGGQADESGPANRVTLSKSPQLIVLSLDLDGTDFETYRATLKDFSGQVIWKDEPLATARSHTLSLALPSSLFHPGDYSLTLEGLSRQGSYTPAGHYAFRVK